MQYCSRGSRNSGIGSRRRLLLLVLLLCYYVESYGFLLVSIQSLLLQISLVAGFTCTWLLLRVLLLVFLT